MQTRDECLQQAQECRRMAAGLPSEEQRAALIQMAETWERLAMDRGSPGAAAVNAQPSSQEAEDDAA